MDSVTADTELQTKGSNSSNSRARSRSSTDKYQNSRQSSIDVATLFSKYDSKGKGVILLTDFVGKFKAICVPSESKIVTTMLGKMDRDCDGILTLTEFMEFWNNLCNQLYQVMEKNSSFRKFYKTFEIDDTILKTTLDYSSFYDLFLKQCLKNSDPSKAFLQLLKLAIDDNISGDFITETRPERSSSSEAGTQPNVNSALVLELDKFKRMLQVKDECIDDMARHLTLISTGGDAALIVYELQAQLLHLREQLVTSELNYKTMAEENLIAQESLNQQVISLSRQISHEKNNEEEVKASIVLIASLEADIILIRTQLKTAEETVVSLNSVLKQCEKSKNITEGKCKKLMIENQEFKQKLEIANKSKESIATGLKKSANSSYDRDVDMEFEIFQKEIFNLKRSLNESDEKLLSANNEYSELELFLEPLESDLNEIRTKQRSSLNGKNVSSAEVEALKKALQKSEEDSVAAVNEYSELELFLEPLETDLNELRIKNRQLETSLQQLEFQNLGVSSSPSLEKYDDVKIALQHNSDVLGAMSLVMKEFERRSNSANATTDLVIESVSLDVMEQAARLKSVSSGIVSKVSSIKELETSPPRVLNRGLKSSYLSENAILRRNLADIGVFLESMGEMLLVTKSSSDVGDTISDVKDDVNEFVQESRRLSAVKDQISAPSLTITASGREVPDIKPFSLHLARSSHYENLENISIETLATENADLRQEYKLLGEWISGITESIIEHAEKADIDLTMVEDLSELQARLVKLEESLISSGKTEEYYDSTLQKEQEIRSIIKTTMKEIESIDDVSVRNKLNEKLLFASGCVNILTNLELSSDKKDDKCLNDINMVVSNLQNLADDMIDSRSLEMSGIQLNLVASAIADESSKYFSAFRSNNYSPVQHDFGTLEEEHEALYNRLQDVEHKYNNLLTTSNVIYDEAVILKQLLEPFNDVEHSSTSEFILSCLKSSATTIIQLRDTITKLTCGLKLNIEHTVADMKSKLEEINVFLEDNKLASSVKVDDSLAEEANNIPFCDYYVLKNNIENLTNIETRIACDISEIMNQVTTTLLHINSEIESYTYVDKERCITSGISKFMLELETIKTSYNTLKMENLELWKLYEASVLLVDKLSLRISTIESKISSDISETMNQIYNNLEQINSEFIVRDDKSTNVGMENENFKRLIADLSKELEKFNRR